MRAQVLSSRIWRKSQTSLGSSYVCLPWQWPAGVTFQAPAEHVPKFGGTVWIPTYGRPLGRCKAVGTHCIPSQITPCEAGCFCMFALSIQNNYTLRPNIDLVFCAGSLWNGDLPSLHSGKNTRRRHHCCWYILSHGNETIALLSTYKGLTFPQNSKPTPQAFCRAEICEEIDNILTSGVSDALSEGLEPPQGLCKDEIHD